MKNNEIKEFVKALDSQAVDTTLFVQGLRRTMLNHPPKRQSIFGRVQATLLNTGSLRMKQNKKVLAFGSLAIMVAIVLIGSVYTYRFSPKALAEQAVKDSLISLQTAPDDKITDLQKKFGGDPAAALREAQAAKDLRVITKEEYQTESAKAGGIFATTLGNDEGPSTGVVGGVSKPTMTFMAKNQNGSVAGAAVGSGTVAFQSALGAEAGQMASPEDAKHLRTVHISSGTPSDQPTNIVTVNTSSGGAQALPTDAPEAFQPEEPAKYLRYTNPEGRVVVLSIGTSGLPIFKTVFMNASDIADMLPSKP
jgi:hypothetical protein